MLIYCCCLILKIKCISMTTNVLLLVVLNLQKVVKINTKYQCLVHLQLKTIHKCHTKARYTESLGKSS